MDLIGVPEGSALELDLRLESVVEGVLVSGTVTTTVAGECARCLEPVSRPFVVDLQELYAYPATDAQGRWEPVTDQDTDDDELFQVDRDRLDLEPALRDAVVLALPVRPLCQEDCAGLCPQCGVRLDSDPDHGHDETDPRWAALRDLTTD